MEFDSWFQIGVAGSFVFAFLVIFYLLRRVNGMRHSSTRAERLAEDMRREWDSFNRNQSERIRQEFQAFEERAGKLEENTERRIRDFEELVTRTREELRSLENYLREVFEVEMKNLFDSFDTTVGSVLTEMKGELLRGVDRLEHIQTVIDGRLKAQKRMIEGREEVVGLTPGLDEDNAMPTDNEGEEGDKDKEQS